MDARGKERSISGQGGEEEEEEEEEKEEEDGLLMLVVVRRVEERRESRSVWTEGVGGRINMSLQGEG